MSSPAPTPHRMWNANLTEFIRPTDWHRIETMIDIVMDLRRRSCSNDVTFGIQCSSDFQVNLGATFGPDKLRSLWPRCTHTILHAPFIFRRYKDPTTKRARLGRYS